MTIRIVDQARIKLNGSNISLININEENFVRSLEPQESFGSGTNQESFGSGAFLENTVAWWDFQDVTTMNTLSSSLGTVPEIGQQVSRINGKGTNSWDLYSRQTSVEENGFWDGVFKPFHNRAANLIPINADESSFNFLHNGDPFSIFLDLEFFRYGNVEQYILSSTNSANTVGFNIWWDCTDNDKLKVRIDNGAFNSFYKELEILNVLEGDHKIVVSNAGVWLDGIFHAFTASGLAPSASNSRNILRVLTKSSTILTSAHEGWVGIARQIIILNREATAQDVTEFSNWSSPDAYIETRTPYSELWNDIYEQDMVAWWDSLDTNQLRKAGTVSTPPVVGDLIDRWTSKGPNSYNLVQPNSIDQPIFKENYNASRNGRVFDIGCRATGKTMYAENKELDYDRFTNGKVCTMFIRFSYEYVSAREREVLVTNGGASQNGISIFVNGNNDLEFASYYGGNTIKTKVVALDLVVGNVYDFIISFLPSEIDTRNTIVAWSLTDTVAADADLYRSGVITVPYPHIISNRNTVSTIPLQFMSNPSGATFSGYLRRVLILKRPATAKDFKEWTSIEP